MQSRATELNSTLPALHNSNLVILLLALSVLAGCGASMRPHTDESSITISALLVIHDTLVFWLRRPAVGALAVLQGEMLNVLGRPVDDWHSRDRLGISDGVCS